MWKLYYSFLRTVEGFDLQEWLIVFAVVVVAGALCLRGFGSRTNY
jgi:hypothetical protein